MAKINKYFEAAVNVAESSDVCQKHGAVIVCDHNIVAENNNVISYHAEHNALKKLRCKKVKQRFL